MKYSFNDIFEVSSGLSKKRSEFGTGAPFVSFKDVFGNPFLPGILSQLAKTDKKEQQRHSVEEGDLFLTRTSEKFEELAMSSVALKTYPEATFNGFTKRLRLKPEYRDSFDIKYIAYFARSNIFRNQVLSMTTMSTRASLNNEMISRLFISAPSKDIQQIISAILYTLDSKIEINNQIISTLEELASTLFKRWFVDFEFPDENGNPYKSSGGKMVDSELGDIPEGWEVQTLNQLVEREKTSFNPNKTTEKEVNHFSFPNFDDFKYPVVEEVNTIKSNKTLITKYPVLFSKMNPEFDRTWLPELSNRYLNVCSPEFVVLNCKDELLQSYIYFLCKSGGFNQYLVSNATGSTGSRQRIKPDVAMSFKLPINENEIDKYSQRCIGIAKKIKLLRNENQTLIPVRDILLPKLLSGEIEIPLGEDV